MRRKLLILFLLPLLLVLLLIGIATFKLPAAVQQAINEGASAGLGVDVSVGDVTPRMGLREASFGLSGRISNPQGFTSPELFSFERFNLSLATPSLLDGVVEVESIVISGPVLSVVQQGSRNNLLEVIQTVRSGLGESTPPEEAESNPSSVRVLVNSLRIEGTQVRVQVAGIPGLEVDETYSLPALTIHRQDLVDEGGGGITIAALSGRLVESLYTEALAYAEAEGHLRPEVSRLLGGGVESVPEALLEEVTDRAREELDKLLGVPGKEGEDLVEKGLKQLFGD